MPINNPPPSSPTSNGIYTGNSAVNRAIPHGLGQAPRIIIITVSGTDFSIFGGKALIDRIDTGAGYAVTTSDGVNFYVGNAGSYNDSANLNLSVYNWVAVG